MTEEIAVRIAEALESIEWSLKLIGMLGSIVIFGVVLLAYILMKDY